MSDFSEGVGLLILRPVRPTDAMLTACSVPEDDAPEYNAATTYGLGDIVMLAATHSVYESGDPANLGKRPDLYPNLWTRIRATNRWRLFDGTNSSRTQQATSISYTFLPGAAVNMVAALGLVDCSQLRVRLIDPTYGTVYDHTAMTGPLPVLPDWWEFFFGTWTGGVKTMLLSDLPSFPNATLQIDLTGLATMAISQLQFGQQREWGVGVEYGARFGRKRYSRREVNDYGEIDFVKRPSSKLSSFVLLLRNSEVDSLLDFLEEVDAELCLFVIAAMYESAILFGSAETNEAQLENATESTMQFEILGAT